MTKATSVLDQLKAQGEKVFTRVSGELMSNPHFMKALQGALKGKEFVDQGVARALKNMNIPTRTEFKKALARIEQLEGEVATLKTQVKKRAKPGPRRKPAGPKPGERGGAEGAEGAEKAEGGQVTPMPPYMPTE